MQHSDPVVKKSNQFGSTTLGKKIVIEIAFSPNLQINTMH